MPVIEGPPLARLANRENASVAYLSPPPRLPSESAPWWTGETETANRMKRGCMAFSSCMIRQWCITVKGESGAE